MGAIVAALAAAAILAGGALAQRPDDRAGAIGVGGTTPDAFERAVDAKVAAAPDAVERAVNARFADGVSGGTATSASSTASGFQWADAALGAAVTIGLLMLGVALVATARRRARVILP
jgi:hypothetical protein